MKTRIVLIGAVVLGWVACTQAATVTYNAANDFSIVNGNPNGVWSYGREAGGVAFSALTNAGTWAGRAPSCPTIESWDNGAAYDPSVNHNADLTNAVNAFGFTWAPNALTLDTFGGNEVAGWPTIRWTAPATGPVDIVGKFTNISNSGNNPVNIHYFRNGVYGGWLGASSPTGLDYSRTGLSFTAGDTIDFVGVADQGGVTKVDLSFSQPAKAAISMQFTDGTNALTFSETAGFVPVEHWNVVGANAAGQTLKNSTGGASGVTVSTPALTLSIAPNPPTFASASDNKLMKTLLFRPNVSGPFVTVGGTIPYAKYDVYVYFNGSDGAYNQAFTLGSDTLVRTGKEVAAVDTVYALSSSNTNGNYVKFGSLTSATMPNFVLNSTGNQYNYINGIQIVDRTNTWTAGWDMLRNEIPNGSESNPNGAWSYGTTPSLSGAFTAYSSGQHTDDAFGQGKGLQGYNAGVPFTTVNTADAHNFAYSTMAVPTDPGQLWIQGPASGSGQNVIRWTSPIDGAISIDASFVKQQNLAPEWTVLHNGVALYSSSGTGNYNLSYLAVSIGDTIDFALASSGSNSDGAMGFDAFIAQVPEPGTLALLATGLIGLLAYAWRKRR